MNRKDDLDNHADQMNPNNDVNGGEMLGHWGVEGQHKCPVKCSA